MRTACGRGGVGSLGGLSGTPLLGCVAGAGPEAWMGERPWVKCAGPGCAGIVVCIFTEAGFKEK